MKDIAIIGGGVAGLTAAYYASKNGIKASLFEESPLCGGRLEYCISLSTPEFQPFLYDFILKELDLSGIEVPFSPSFIGMLAGDRIMGYEAMPEMIKQLPQDQAEYFGRLSGEAMQSNFDIEAPSENLTKLRDVSFAEYLKDCPPQLMEMMIKPMFAFTFMREVDLSKISAEYGLFNIRFALEMGKDNVQTLEEGIRFFADILTDKIKKQGVEVNLSSEVVGVEKIENGFQIRYRHLKEEKTEEAKKIIVATTLKRAKEMLPELDVGIGVDCEKTKLIFTNGRLKTEKKVLMGFPGNKANLRLLFVSSPENHHIYPWDIDQPVNFDFLYDDYKILEEKEIEEAFPYISAKARMPEIKSNIKDIYLCGDFFYYPVIETSVRTGKKAAEIVKKEL